MGGNQMMVGVRVLVARNVGVRIGVEVMAEQEVNNIPHMNRREKKGFFILMVRFIVLKTRRIIDQAVVQ